MILNKKSVQKNGKNDMKKMRSKNGFTLIELLVAISIIGVLAAILVVNLVGARGRAKDAAKKEGVNQLRTALRLYYNDFQSYPAGVAKISGALCSSGVCNAGEEFFSGTTTYMKALPTHNYYQKAGGEGYIVRVQLDNPSDDSIATNYDKCCGSAASGCPADAAAALSGKIFVMCED